MKPSTRIIHVTKEFGPATMGGLGAMLTALSVAQADSPYLHVAVVLPHYSYLDDDFAGQIEPVVSLPVAVADGTDAAGQARTKPVKCAVSRLRWTYAPDSDFLSPALEVEGEGEQAKRTIEIFLVGPGDASPFHVAFKAKDAGDVYTAYKPLKQEWKDLWFAKATAELIGHLNQDTVEPSPVKTGASRQGGVDVVHLHGATNAMVAYYLRQAEKSELLGSHPPSIVYTLHDSLDEVEYSNLVSNQASFLPGAAKRLSGYTYGDQVFTSALGIDLADMATFVSRSIATDMVEGRFRFPLSELVMPSIGRRAKAGSFVGVTNGLDFTEPSKNPFTSPLLVEQGLAFPRVGRDLADFRTFYTHDRPGATASAASFQMAKQAAKEFLLQALPGTFHRADLDRPWFLFVGRFQYNKGCQFFEPLLEAVTSAAANDARLVVMGARNNFPIRTLRLLERHYPDHFTLIDDSTDLQARFGTVVRTASDFAFVPSFSEAFGLVAAEGMLFGMTVVSSGVGGLGEFLSPVSSSGTRGNAHLFDLFDEAGLDGVAHPANGTDWSIDEERTRLTDEELGPAKERAQAAVLEAVRAWRTRADDRETAWSEREVYVRRLVAEALELGWSREGGPVEEYIRVYDRAITNRRHTKSPSPSTPDAVRSAEHTPPPEQTQLVHYEPYVHVQAPLAGAVPHHVELAQPAPEQSVLFIPQPALAHDDDGDDDDGVQAERPELLRAGNRQAHELPLYKVWTEDDRALARLQKDVARLGGAEKLAQARWKGSEGVNDEKPSRESRRRQRRGLPRGA